MRLKKRPIRLRASDCRSSMSDRIDRARADGDARARVERLLELHQLLDGSRQVRVGEEHPRAAGREHAATDAGALAQVLRIAEHAAALPEPADDRLRDARRVVARAVVHDEQLVVHAARIEVADDAFQRGGQSAGLVVGGNDDGQLRGIHHDPHDPPGEVTGHAGPVGHGASAMRTVARCGLRARDGASMKRQESTARTSVAPKAAAKNAGMEMDVPAAWTIALLERVGEHVEAVREVAVAAESLQREGRPAGQEEQQVRPREREHEAQAADQRRGGERSGGGGGEQRAEGHATRAARRACCRRRSAAISRANVIATPPASGAPSPASSACATSIPPTSGAGSPRSTAR